MKLQPNTLKKISEIKEMIRNGADEKEIIKIKFKSSPKAFHEWIQKFGEYLKNDINITHDITYNITHEKPRENGNSNMLYQFFTDEKQLKNFKKLIENSDKILELVNNKNNNVEDIYILDLSKVDKYNDIKTKSYRVSEELDKEFTELAKNKKVSVVSFLKLAMLEAIEKYSK